MPQSMTGYGRHAENTEFGELTWEIRSVNHRYLELGMRLPDELRGLEPSIRERASKRLHRGKVDVSLRFRNRSDAAADIPVDADMLRVLGKAVDVVKSTFPDAEPVDPIRVLQWPGVIGNSASQIEAIKDQAKHGFEQALEDFIQSREREGQNVSELLQDRADKINDQLKAIMQFRPQVVQRQKEKLVQRLQELDIEHDVGRLEQELVYVAQRLDIDEELDRLSVHIKEFNKALRRTGSIGRRLDFLMQEFNREANTIASKSADSDTTGASVEIKVLIEQMREQVQNIE